MGDSETTKENSREPWLPSRNVQPEWSAESYDNNKSLFSPGFSLREKNSNLGIQKNVMSGHGKSNGFKCAEPGDEASIWTP